MTYSVHQIFRTIQGEGANMGKAAVFVRFAGCNLWSGREEDRESAVCRFCDTDFRNGTKYSRPQLVESIRRLASAGLIVFTGGEPALQLDQDLVDELHGSFGFEIAIETNGTRPIPRLQWVCVSPKAGTSLAVEQADELKFVFPQGPGFTPDDALAAVTARHLWLSPMDGPQWAENVALAIDYIHRDPRWRLNIQAHKFWRIP